VLPTGTFSSGVSITGVAVAGNLNGGAASSPNNTQPYDWVFTYSETATSDEGNPSQTMSAASAVVGSGGLSGYAGVPIAVNGGQVNVAIWGTGVAGIGKINVYRRGGTLTDELYRLVTSVTNPGSETTTTILDNTADADLVYNNIASLYNNPPVTSTLPTPIKTTSSGSTAAGWATMTVASSVLGPVLPGTLIHILDPASSEDVVVESSTGTTFRAYFQFTHAGSTPVECDAITGAPCNLVMSMQDSLLVAGDINNPHMLYKSATGGPQYFPVGLDAAGAITTVGVGTPSNGIVNLCEFRGQVLCLNVSSLFETYLASGSLFAPNKVADKGLVAQSAWCKTPMEVWFLSDDGIYSWDGSGLRKRTLSIDPMFHGQSVNGLVPIVYEQTQLQAARMEYRGGFVYFLYQDSSGKAYILRCEPAFGDRWTPILDSGSLAQLGPNVRTTMLFTEPDTKTLITVGETGTVSGNALFGICEAVVLSGSGPVLNLTADWYSTGIGTDGVPIVWSMTLPWFDMGKPNWKKLFEEIWLDMDPQLYNGPTWLSTLSISLLLDYVDSPVETFTITPASNSSIAGRQLLSLLPLLSSVSGTYESFGREARAISFVITGNVYGPQMSLFNILIQYQETGQLTAGGVTDWDNLGYQWDKKLYTMTVEFDTEGTNRTIVLDTMTGLNGNTYNAAVQTFVLSNPVITGAGRARCVRPINDSTIVKLVRVRQVASVQAALTLATTFFKIHSVKFDPFEQFPADIVGFTAWENGGSEYAKYINQVDLQVNTNNVAVSVQIQGDGGTLLDTVPVQSTEKDRQRNFTLPTGLQAYEYRLFVDMAQTAIVSGGGMFQLFKHRFAVQPADKGEVGHTFQWDELNHPFDKYLETVSIDWDLTGLSGLTLQMDTITGITGQTLNTNVAQFVLGSARGRQTFPLQPDTIVKMIRLYPFGAVPVGYKQWKYEFKQTNYPADIVLSTGWRDAGTPDDKNPSWLSLDMDTAGVPTAVSLMNEKGDVMNVTHTGTLTNRKANYPVPVDTYGKMWRLLLIPGTGGKAQLFGWGFARWHPFEQGGGEDPPDAVLFTPWNDFGYPYQKMARNLLLTIDTGGTLCKVALQTQEAGTVQGFPVTTTYTTRRVAVACNANLQGMLWRLVLTPSVGGKAKLWDWGLDNIKMPPALTQWSSYGQSFGYIGWKFMPDAWIDYVCAGGLTLVLSSDDGSYTINFPAHANRAVERYNLPSPWGAGHNKSKLYGVFFAAVNPTQPFQIFAETSGLEFMPCGADRHAAYQKKLLSEFMSIPI